MIDVKHVFGRTISFRYTPMVDGEDHSAFSLTSARVYSSFPTDAQVENTTTGHLDEATSWTAINVEGSGSTEYLIAFDPISDPSPHSTSKFEKYFVALNFVVESGATDIFDVEQLFVWREDGVTSKIRCSTQDVYDIDQTIEDVAPSETWTQGKVNKAIDHYTLLLGARGYKRGQTFDMEKISYPTALLAASMCGWDLAKQGNAIWFEKARQWRADADALFDAVKLGYDQDGDDQPEPDESTSTGAVAFVR
jgi:hypothetical protein